ncbi:MAG: ABC transporter related protein [Candidatus Roizmanbacteria bacterium GW2011_GWC2_34_23]|uniref:ABC transporter related protein n=1 Tax=Candidatus Roizmanbacteria bacterium GW2011_GWC2_34_23 TaxID=1618484 RepID=A0A0G0B0G4_9BACT|nr:MAG: ABC transporter related protein [Candidatus Roizmanbacteria bacterium GW2011_GWC2_34_23]
MSAPKLIIKNLSKNYLLSNKKTVTALKNFNLKVFPGEFVSIIGPSGCGKTTLFNIIAGVEEQTFGTISLDGNIENSRQGKFGYMFQNPLLLPWRTIKENLILGLDIKKVSKEIAFKKAFSLLKEFNLEKYEDQYPSVLSGGMKQKVSLLRTLLFNDSFLLLDEPFGALDQITRQSLQLWLKQVLKKFMTTTLFITHDIREAKLLSDRIIKL